MKDGRTHLAHMAEHAVDLETGAIVGVTVQGADQGATSSSRALNTRPIVSMLLNRPASFKPVEATKRWTPAAKERLSALFSAEVFPSSGVPTGIRRG